MPARIDQALAHGHKAADQERQLGADIRIQQAPRLLLVLAHTAGKLAARNPGLAECLDDDDCRGEP
ncbi:hypothetical protein HFN60_07235 [Rhizobium leguminosarum]|uniref:hypothetical protein n=1 Tax=Rhizobium leguminosarum TaxID=384 RepID=UPI001C95A3FF|nr:hypothetical protein [Rhizobium leguminosarum]MBY5815444.1 hypothetical protein [Rhizobium leguminosarum]